MRIKVILACDECKSRNYSTMKNKSVNPERLCIKKFCKNCGKHTEHKETK